MDWRLGAGLALAVSPSTVWTWSSTRQRRMGARRASERGDGTVDKVGEVGGERRLFRSEAEVFFFFCFFFGRGGEVGRGGAGANDVSQPNLP